MDLRRVVSGDPRQKPSGAEEVLPCRGDRVRPILLQKANTVGHLGFTSDWFMDLFGFREVSYDDVQRRITARPVDDTPDAKWILEGEIGRSYQVGRFWTPTLAELEATALAQGGMKALPGRLRVRSVRGDVSEFHAHPANRHATFQVASQFNCLEYVGPYVCPEDGITGYVHDKTQGPACSIACGPATAFRNYFANVDGHTGQRYDRQINNLRQLCAKLWNKPEEAYFQVVGGFTLAYDEDLRRMNSHLAQLDDESYQALRKELCVGLHEDVQVTSRNWGEFLIEDAEQTVTQVLGSACAVSYSGNNHALWEPLARLVLSASYEATLWAALLTALRHATEGSSRRAFLTCLGGGVFGNKLEWIVDAMAEAFSRFQNVDLEVCIVTYGGTIERPLQQLERRFSV